MGSTQAIPSGETARLIKTKMPQHGLTDARWSEMAESCENVDKQRGGYGFLLRDDEGWSRSWEVENEKLSPERFAFRP